MHCLDFPRHFPLVDSQAKPPHCFKAISEITRHKCNTWSNFMFSGLISCGNLWNATLHILLQKEKENPSWKVFAQRTKRWLQSWHWFTSACSLLCFWGQHLLASGLDRASHILLKSTLFLLLLRHKHNPCPKLLVVMVLRSALSLSFWSKLKDFPSILPVCCLRNAWWFVTMCLFWSAATAYLHLSQRLQWRNCLRRIQANNQAHTSTHVTG